MLFKKPVEPGNLGKHINGFMEMGMTWLKPVQLREILPEIFFKDWD
jgi:hypothetical protein